MLTKYALKDTTKVYCEQFIKDTINKQNNLLKTYLICKKNIKFIIGWKLNMRHYISEKAITLSNRYF